MTSALAMMSPAEDSLGVRALCPFALRAVSEGPDFLSGYPRFRSEAANVWSAAATSQSAPRKSVG